MSQSTPLPPSVVDVLRPAIIQILENADLSSISAKRVRGQLAQLPAGTLPESLDLSASKKQVDEVIRDCFDQISKSMPAPPQAASSRNGGSSAPPSGGIALPGLGGVRGSHNTAQSSASPAPIKAGSTKTLNGSSTKVKQDVKPKKKPAKKRPAPTDDDDNDDEPKKKRAANPNNPFNRPLVLSPLLAEVCGGPEVCTLLLATTCVLLLTTARSTDASACRCQAALGVHQGQQSAKRKQQTTGTLLRSAWCDGGLLTLLWRRSCATRS